MSDSDKLLAEQLKNAALAEALKEQKSKVKDTPSVVAPLTVPTDVFKNGKDEYQFVCVAFSHAGVKYTAADAIKDKSLMIELIELQAGFLKKL